VLWQRGQLQPDGNILKTDAQIVVTTNPGCMLQIQAGLAKAGATEIKVMHISDFLLLFASKESNFDS
jgi:hypothetical protein